MVEKWPWFQLFFFRQYSTANCLLRYSSKKNVFLGYKNNKFSKSKNWDFSNEFNPWFWSKNGYLSNFFFKAIYIVQEIVFYDILERKNAFLGYKNNKFKKSKNWDFFKWGNTLFWSKNGLFCNFFFFKAI